jgi:hypothetical protein
MSKENSLFKTDKVRDLISELYTAYEAGKSPSIKALDYALYSELGSFMDMVGEYDTVDKRNTLKNYLVGIICSDSKYNSDTMKIKKIDSFIASVKAENKLENKQMLDAMEVIKTELPTMLTVNSSEKCKEKIVGILSNYFKTNTFTPADNIKHENLKKKILAAPEKDRILFLNFADFVKCGIDNCDDPTKSTVETEGSRFNLRKKNGDVIVLLELFSGSKDVSVLMSSKDVGMVEKITNFIYDYIKAICVSIALMLGTYVYYKKFGNTLPTMGALPSSAQLKLAGYVSVAFGLVYLILSQMMDVKRMVISAVSAIISFGYNNPWTTAGVSLIIAGLVWKFQDELKGYGSTLSAKLKTAGDYLLTKGGEGLEYAGGFMPTFMTDFWKSLKAKIKITDLQEFIDFTIGSVQIILVPLTILVIGKFSAEFIQNKFSKLIGFIVPLPSSGVQLKEGTYEQLVRIVSEQAYYLTMASTTAVLVSLIIDLGSYLFDKGNIHILKEVFNNITELGKASREVVENYFMDVEKNIEEGEKIIAEWRGARDNLTPDLVSYGELEASEKNIFNKNILKCINLNEKIKNQKQKLTNNLEMLNKRKKTEEATDTDNPGLLEKYEVKITRIKNLLDEINSCLDSNVKLKDFRDTEKIKISENPEYTELENAINDGVKLSLEDNQLTSQNEQQGVQQDVQPSQGNRLVMTAPSFNQGGNFQVQKLSNQYFKKNNSRQGGAMTKCLKLPSLKQRLLSRLVKFGAETSNETDLRETECDDSILPAGKSFVLDASKIINDASECEPAMDSMSRTEKLNCLRETGLKRRHRANTSESKKWTTLDKNMNSPNLLITPNMMQILKGSTFPSAINYQLGGGDIEENREFIKTSNQDVKIQYSYQIVSLLKKALQRLNNNGIYLEKKVIDEIQAKIGQLRDAETSLAKYAENIVQAGKISVSRPENNNVMDDSKLNDYVRQHKMLVQNADKTAIKLNTVFIKLLELFNEKGDKIMSAIEKNI